MSDDIPSFVPSDDSAAMSMVRTMTNYDGPADGVDDAALAMQLRLSKTRLYNLTGVEDVYSDSGLAQTLVAATAIYTKAAVENYSIQSWSIGDQQIETGAFDNPESAQFTMWHQLHLEGLRSSDATDSMTPSNTARGVGHTN